MYVDDGPIWYEINPVSDWMQWLRSAWKGSREPFQTKDDCHWQQEKIFVSNDKSTHPGEVLNYIH